MTLVLLALSGGQAFAQNAEAVGPSIRRSANLPDGAPAFDVLDAGGRRVVRIECIWNGWYEADAMAARVLGSTSIMAAIIDKGGRIELEDLGPAKFDCTVVPGRASAGMPPSIS